MSMLPFSSIGRRLRRLWRREDGTATIEFVFCIPVTLMIVMASMESGLYMVRSALMERGLDLVMREFRLGRMAKMDYTQIRDKMCEYTIYVADCKNNLKVWIQPINTFTWELPDASSIYCGDRNFPLTSPPIPGSAAATGSNDIVLVRVCALEDPIFPSTPFAMRLRKDSTTGQYELTSATVVVTEPR